MTHRKQSSTCMTVCHSLSFLPLLLLLSLMYIFALMLFRPPMAEAANMYWIDKKGINRADLNGQNLETILPVTQRLHIAVDTVSKKVYWSDADAEKIQRANLDGSNVEDLVTTGLISPIGIAVDVVRRKLYWTDNLTHKIQRANLDGTNIEDILTGLKEPQGIAVDVVDGKIYWVDEQER